MVATVHIVLPFRDAAATLGDALDCLLAQEFPHWTATLIDDGSTDAGPRLAAAYALRDARFELLRPGRVGLPSALNLGVDRRGSATFLARFDADDRCDPRRFALQVEAFAAEPTLAVLDTRWEPFGDVAGGMLRYRDWHDGICTDADFRREELVESPICHPAVMLRCADPAVATLISAGPYRDGPFPEDYDLWLRLRRIGATFRKLPQRLVGWRDSAARATRIDPRYGADGHFAVRWEHALATYLPARPRLAVWGASKRGRPWIRELVRGGHDLVAVIDIDAARTGHLRRGIPVRTPAALGELRPDLVIAAVGAPGARSVIAEALRPLGIPHIAVAGLDPAAPSLPSPRQ